MTYLLEPADKICIVSHDAGGAEVLSSYVRANRLHPIYHLQGPVIKVFNNKLGPVRSDGLEEAVRRSDVVICSTSWQSDIELNAIDLARALGKKSIAYLDHWTNYRERFEHGGNSRTPDEIWTADPIAEKMAGDVWPNIPVRMVGNPYLDDVRREIDVLRIGSPTQPNRAARVLYASESIAEHGELQFGDPLHWGYTEQDALRYLMENLDAFGTPVEKVILRPHPSEPREKYDWVRGTYGDLIKVGGSVSLLEEMTTVDIVAGCSTMAMVIGLAAGLQVINVTPPGGKTFNLPHKEIVSLQALCKSVKNS